MSEDEIRMFCKAIAPTIGDFVRQAMAPIKEAVKQCETRLNELSKLPIHERLLDLKATNDLLRGIGERIAKLEHRPAMVYRGVFEQGKEYRMGDAVTESGGCWVCRVPSTREKPGSSAGDWQLAVKRGRDGKDGSR